MPATRAPAETSPGAITLFGTHSVNWSRDNRSAAARSLVEDISSATRIELRSGASDANKRWPSAGRAHRRHRRTGPALNLDRHGRNVRTVATHDPLAYKAYAAGN